MTQTRRGGTEHAKRRDLIQPFGEKTRKRYNCERLGRWEGKAKRSLRPANGETRKWKGAKELSLGRNKSKETMKKEETTRS